MYLVHGDAACQVECLMRYNALLKTQVLVAYEKLCVLYEVCITYVMRISYVAYKKCCSHSLECDMKLIYCLFIIMTMRRTSRMRLLIPSNYYNDNLLSVQLRTEKVTRNYALSNV